MTVHKVISLKCIQFMIGHKNVTDKLTVKARFGNSQKWENVKEMALNVLKRHCGCNY